MALRPWRRCGRPAASTGSDCRGSQNAQPRLESPIAAHLASDRKTCPGDVRQGERSPLLQYDQVQIRIVASDLPGRSCGPSPEAPNGYQNIHVGVQRRNRPDELLDLVPGDASSATWTVDCKVGESPSGVDLHGPYIQGPPGGRFIYLSWGTVDDAKSFTMFRRAKLWFDAIPLHVMEGAVNRGLLVGRLGLTDGQGLPLCAAVRPPAVEWSAGAANR